MCSPSFSPGINIFFGGPQVSHMVRGKLFSECKRDGEAHEVIETLLLIMHDYAINVRLQVCFHHIYAPVMYTDIFFSETLSN